MLDRIRRRGADESGVVAVLVAIMMVVFLGMAALAVDVGSFYKAQSQAQVAADAGALAAADNLPSATSATTAGTSLATTNYPGSTVTVAAPYNGTTNQAKVTVNVSTPAFFGQIFGVTKANVSATAVAQSTVATSSCATPGATCDAIFAMDSNCSGTGVSFAGGGYNIKGGIHSNGSINTGGGGSTYGATTYGNGSGCTKTTGGGDTFASGPTAQAPVTTWPIDYSDAAHFPACAGAACTGPSGTPSYCTYSTSATPINFTGSSPPTSGFYCAYGTGTPSNPATYNGVITLSGGSIGTASNPIQISIIAGNISTGSGSEFLQAYNYPTNQLLIYATGTGNAVNLGGGGNTWTGDFFVPNGTVTVAAGSQSTGFLEADDVSFTSGGIFLGDGPPVSGTTTTTGAASLVQ